MKDDILTTKIVTHYEEPAEPVDWFAFKKVVESRRSVRIFDDTPIPETIMRECLKLALLAPTSSNLQCWEFVWVRSSDKKAKLVEACLGQNAAKTAQELIVCVARTNTWNSNRKQIITQLKSLQDDLPRAPLKYYEKIVPFFYSQGPLGVFGLFKKVLFFLVGIFRPTPRDPTSNSQLRAWAIKTTALACENLMLALRTAGFDSCPMEGLDARRVKSLLKLSCDAHIVMVIGAGKRAKDGIWTPRMRLPEQQFIREV